MEDLNNLVRADVTTKNKQKAQEIFEKLDEMETRIKEVLEKEEMSKLRPPISGDEIMSLFDLEPGPKVGVDYEGLVRAKNKRRRSF